MLIASTQVFDHESVDGQRETKEAFHIQWGPSLINDGEMTETVHKKSLKDLQTWL